ncbi:glycosyl transferase [Candidatus Velamenicoccus archaeovorus]|uniref:Glycosyl transferase n=1 Tax=Velamenicoccus archaeovorus TaxID=1930593 RepID=A0A410P496_VELA1|nr:glycosyltransferase family 2 protein [Candidatus Velamenicoccus archaeovorus]QAT17009.1 glycosyl transferase [Candidatus Velamenicoccus archaeovorus]
MSKTGLSVVILTKNEEENIAACIKSLKGWADEIIVVDDMSSDKTVPIAQELADKVLIKKMDVEGTHRNWAYAQARNAWVLSLDADETVTPELQSEITAAIASTEHACFSVPLRNYIGNHWVRYGGWYPAAKVRLFDKNKFKYEDVVVHPRAFVDGTCGHLKCDIVHKGYPDFGHFLASLNRQTTLEAQKWITTNRKMGRGRIAWRAIDRFFRRYIGKKGWKDGYIGFMVAFYDTMYQLISYAKFRQMLDEKEQKTESREQITEHRKDL